MSDSIVLLILKGNIKSNSIQITEEKIADSEEGIGEDIENSSHRLDEVRQYIEKEMKKLKEKFLKFFSILKRLIE